MKWTVPRIWEGGDVWILGGGPSVTDVFNIPKEVVAQVKRREANPSIYSPYMEKIHNKHVIGINIAYQIGDWIDMVFFGDSNFYRTYSSTLSKFPGLKISCHNATERVSWVKHLSQDPTRKEGISRNPATVSWNKNSGAAAISVAVHTGAKRIILLGFDMNLSADNTQHWHSVYRLGGSKADKLPFKRHLLGFPKIERDAKEMGVEILNCSPNSAITQFRKVTLEEVL